MEIQSEISRKDKIPYYRHLAPIYMLAGPHMIHLNGSLVHPGIDNDYTIEFIKGQGMINWWHDLAARAKEDLLNMGIDIEMWRDRLLLGIALVKAGWKVFTDDIAQAMQVGRFLVRSAVHDIIVELNKIPGVNIQVPTVAMGAAMGSIANLNKGRGGAGGGTSAFGAAPSGGTGGGVAQGGGSAGITKFFSNFDNGGIIPGPIGQPRIVVAHGGETILPTHKSGGGVNITINANIANDMDIRILAQKLGNAVINARAGAF